MDKSRKLVENRLIRAVRLRKLKWVRNRLAEGMDPNWMDPDPIARMTSKTPLIQAIQVRDASVARLLLEHGADPNLECCHNTPILAAAAVNAVGIVALLLESGADADRKNALGQCPETVCFGEKGAEIRKLVSVWRARRAVDVVIARASAERTSGCQRGAYG